MHLMLVTSTALGTPVFFFFNFYFFLRAWKSSSKYRLSCSICTLSRTRKNTCIQMLAGLCCWKAWLWSLFFSLPFKYIFLHVLKIVGESRLFLFHHFDFACNRVISWDRHGENLEVIFYFNLKAKLVIELMDQQHSIYTACNFYSLAVPQGAKLK